MLTAKCQTPGLRFILALLFCLALVIPASARDWRIARFESHIYVAPDGVTTVNEHIDAGLRTANITASIATFPSNTQARTAPTTPCSSKSPASSMAAATS